jgi:hypothetical protein
MAQSSEIARPDSALLVGNADEEFDIDDAQAKNADFDSSNAGFEKPPLLPRNAWKSQLAFLKAILKAKQALDRREKTIF